MSGATEVEVEATPAPAPVSSPLEAPGRYDEDLEKALYLSGVDAAVAESLQGTERAEERTRRGRINSVLNPRPTTRGDLGEAGEAAPPPSSAAAAASNAYGDARVGPASPAPAPPSNPAAAAAAIAVGGHDCPAVAAFPGVFASGAQDGTIATGGRR